MPDDKQGTTATTPDSQGSTTGSNGTIHSTTEHGTVASHQARDTQPFLVAPTTTTDFNTLGLDLIPVACLSLHDILFEFDSSFPTPDVAIILKELPGLREKHKNSKGQLPPASVFGHADPVGGDAFNKPLSGRRARAIYGLLTHELGIWEHLFNEEWSSGNAIKTMQAATGKPAGTARKDLMQGYMTLLFPGKLEKSDFLGQGADPKGKADLQGCSDFNPLVVLSEKENQTLPHEKRNQENQPNRRVVVFLFRAGLKVNAKLWPCPAAEDPSTAACKARFFGPPKTGDSRRKAAAERREFAKTSDTFACRFYDRVARLSPCEKPGPVVVLVNPLIVLAGGTAAAAASRVAVKRPYTNPQRAQVTLKTDKVFDGSGSLTRSSAGIRLFTNDAAHTEIQFDGKDNTFAGPKLTAGVTLLAEGAQASGAMNDITLTLTLSGGSKTAGPPATLQMTAVEVTLDICQKRTSPKVDPAKLDAKDKVKPGRLMPFQLGISPRTMIIVEQPKPADFKGTLTLEPLDDKVQIFAAEIPSKGEAALTTPVEIKASDIPANGTKMWVQGVKLSGDLTDTGLRLGIKDLKETECDKVGASVCPAIAAENGIDPAPTVMPVKNLITEPAKTNILKLSVAPKGTPGNFVWSSASSLFKLTDVTSALVTLTSDKTPSASPESEEIRLTYTPSGKSAFPVVTHNLGVADVVFSSEASHDWGYDAYEEIACMDSNNNSSKKTPDPKRDILSVKKSSTGKVKVDLKGAKPADVFYKSQGEGIARPKVKQPGAASEVLQIDGGAIDKNDTILEAHLVSESGPVVAELGVVVLKQINYEAEFFRVKDSTSAGTALSATPKAADLQKECNKYYKAGVADWKITGGASELDIAYDIIKNGALDLEPGATTAEQKKIMDNCSSSKTRVVYVHDLHWSYYLATDAAATDTKIKIKNYGTTYLGYIGTQSYQIEDSKGHSTAVTVSAVNTGTGEVTLSAAIGQAFKTGDKAALIWPLGGLSGDPLWVKDVGDIPNYVAHELGHTLADLLDAGEVDNIMYGGPTTGKKLRHRPIPVYYTPASNEEQWKKMKGR